MAVRPHASDADLRCLLEVNADLAQQFPSRPGARVHCGLDVLGRSADKTWDNLWVSCQQYYTQAGDLHSGRSVRLAFSVNLTTSPTLRFANANVVGFAVPAVIERRLRDGALKPSVDESANVLGAWAAGDLLPAATARGDSNLCPAPAQPVTVSDGSAAFAAVRAYATRRDPSLTAHALRQDPATIAANDHARYSNLVAAACGEQTAARTLVIRTTRTDQPSPSSTSSDVYFVSRVDGVWVVWQQVH